MSNYTLQRDILKAIVVKLRWHLIQTFCYENILKSSLSGETATQLNKALFVR